MTTETTEKSEKKTTARKPRKAAAAKRATTTTTRRKTTKKTEEVVEQTEIKPQDEANINATLENAIKEEKESIDDSKTVSEEKEVSQKEIVEPQSKDIPQKEESKLVHEKKQEVKPIPPMPNVIVKSIVDLVSAPHRQLLLSDQQIQQLTVDEAIKRYRWMEGTLAWILDYDIVISDTNIWLELLVGHTSSHSDPKVNARLLFERQLDFISKLTHYRRGRFMMMSETYEEIDRFATQQAPTNYKDADFTDEALCRNVAARLAKRLILSLQRENRLRIEGIGSESHHAAFADPAIIRRTVELFAQGKKVLLITNDASVGIRSLGMCDDLQRHNGIDDDTWEKVYTPLRPMVMTMDDLKVIDNYTRQFHFLQMAAGKMWMEDVPQQMELHNVMPLTLWLEGFRPGDKYAESKVANTNTSEQRQQRQQNQKQQNQKQQQKQQSQHQNQQQDQQSKQNQQHKAEANVEKTDLKAEGKSDAKVEQKAEQNIEKKQNAQQKTKSVKEVVVQESASVDESKDATIETPSAQVAPIQKKRPQRRRSPRRTDPNKE